MRGGFGMGRGRGCWPAAGPFIPQVPITTPATPIKPPQMSKEQEIVMLKSQMKSLEQQLDQIRKRLKELSARE